MNCLLCEKGYPKKDDVHTSKAGKDGQIPPTECKDVDRTTLMIHQVPKKLKARFKIACQARKSNMRYQLLWFMEAYSAKAGF